MDESKSILGVWLESKYGPFEYHLNSVSHFIKRVDLDYLDLYLEIVFFEQFKDRTGIHSIEEFIENFEFVPRGVKWNNVLELYTFDICPRI